MLSAKNITKSFGEKKVIDGFSHEFGEGVTAIVGASGCGKTTLVSLLMGLISPDSGEIRREGRISAVFQEDRLCENLTVSANIRLVTGKRYSRAQIAAECARVGLGGAENTPARELSGGMKRRTALLRALLAEYDILFLDEPFKGLDEATKASVMDYCAEKTRGKTVVLVTHDSAECERLAGEVISLSDNAEVRHGD